MLNLLNQLENLIKDNLKKLTKDNFKNLIKDNLKFIVIALFIVLLLTLLYYGIVPTYSGASDNSGVTNNSGTTNDIIGLLIQTEAAVIAVIITLSLVVIQLAAQTYSARVIEIIKGNKLFLIVIAGYIFTISYGIALLICLDNFKPPFTPDLILIEYYLSIWIFIALIPLFFSIINSLKPSKMIDILIERVTGTKIKDAIIKNENSDINENKKAKIDSSMEFLNYKQIIRIKPDINADIEPILPIIDIIQSSIIQNDFETIKHGFKEIDSKINKILENAQEEDKEAILRLILTYLTRIGIQAIQKEDEDAVNELIELMNKLTNIAITENFINPLILSADSFTKICRIAIKKELENPSGISSTSLGLIGQVVSKKKIEDLTVRIANSLIKIGSAAIDLEFNDTVFSTTFYIGKMTETSPQKFKIRHMAINYIGEAGKYSVKKQFNLLEKHSALELQDISIIAVNEDDTISLRDISKNLLDIGIISLEQGSRDQAIFCETILKKISMNCVNQGLEREVIEIQRDITKMAKAAMKSKFDYVELVFSQEIVEIGKWAIENERIINTIKGIPIITEKIEFEVILDKIKRYKKFSSNRVINEVIASIASIGKIIAEKKEDYSTNQIIDLLLEVYEYEQIDISSLVFKIGDISEIAIKQSLYSSINAIVDFIFRIIHDELNKPNSIIFMIATNKLGNIANLSMEKEQEEEHSYEKDKLKEMYIRIIDSLIEFAKITIKNKDEKVIYALDTLRIIGETAANLEHNDILNKIMDVSKDIGNECIDLKLPFALNVIISIFGAIGEITIKKGFRNLPHKSINFFYENIESIVEMEAHLALSWTVYYLGIIGKTATEKKFVNITEKCIKLSENVEGFILEKIESNKAYDKYSDNEITEYFNLLYNLFDIGKTAISLADIDTLNKVKKSFKSFSIQADYYKLDKIKEIMENYISELEELEKNKKII